MQAILIVDIGSSSVGAAIVSLSKNTAPNILFSTRSAVPFQPDRGQTRSLPAVLSALDSVLTLASTQKHSLHTAHVFFSSPWYKLQTKVVKKTYDRPVKVTHHLVNEMIEETEENIVATPGNELDKFKVAEHRIVAGKINGYTTTNPYNKKAKDIELAFFSSLIPQEVLDSVKKTVNKHFHTWHYEVSSFSLAAFTVISGILPTENNYLIVDVRGEASELSVVTEGALMKSETFPIGKNALIKTVAEGTGQSGAASLSLINMAMGGKSDDATKEQVIKLVDDFKQKWLQAYSETVKKLSAESRSSIFLISDSDVEVFFENTLNAAEINGNLHLLRHLNVRGFVASSPAVTDEFLALESIFVTMVKAFV